MKSILRGVAVTVVLVLQLLWTTGAQGQGLINFANRIPGELVAPVYGPEPGDPTRAITGQSSIGTPAGTTVYLGPLLAGTGYTAQLWAGPVGTTEDALVLCQADGGRRFATSTFRTGTGAGFLQPLLYFAEVPGVPGVPGSRATFQMRAWDNCGGTVTSWEQALAQADTVPHGASPLFTPPYELVEGLALPPNLVGLQSFNLYIVPEPSAVALVALGGGLLLFFGGTRIRSGIGRSARFSSGARSRIE